MVVPRNYSVRGIKELVEFFRNDSNISADCFAGMLKVVELLVHFEHMTDLEIEAEVCNVYRAI